jgi:hypothetical protein
VNKFKKYCFDFASFLHQVVQAHLFFASLNTQHILFDMFSMPKILAAHML